MKETWVRKVRKTYRVYREKDGQLLAEGSAAACAEQLGIEIQGFYKAVCKAQAGKHRKYRIEVLPASLIPGLSLQAEERALQARRAKRRQELTNEELQLAQEWDAFCEPIRKKYGIAVKRDDG